MLSQHTLAARGLRAGAAKPVLLRSSAKGRARLVPRAQAPPESATATATVEKSQPDDEHPPTKSPYGRSILLQGFAWDSWKIGGGNWYGKLQEAIPDMQALGVTHIWLPPPSHSVSAEGYLPGQLYDLESKYGNQEQLVGLIAALKEAGIKPMADIVINHRCADEKGHKGAYNEFNDVVEHEGRSIDWGRWAITSNDPHFHGNGNPDTGEDFPAAPDLDHLNPELRAALKDWLKWLQNDIGFEGWRFDYCKGYGAQFIGEYVEASVGGDVLNVGELWTDMNWNDGGLDYNQDAQRQQIVDWVNGAGKKSTAFDFPLKAQLQEACRNTQFDRLRDGQGKAIGVNGWWPSKAVTFIENHDTGSTQQHWPFPSEHVGMGYAYLLTHPGIPCIFWDHAFTWGDDVKGAIKDLTALRRRAGIHSQSNLEILAADHDLYVARIDDKVVLKMGPKHDMGDLLPKEEDGWKFAMAGNDWAVWERA